MTYRRGSAELAILQRVAELNARGCEPSVWETVTGQRWPATGRLSARGRSYRYTVVSKLLQAGELEDVAQSGATSKRLRIGRTEAPSEALSVETLRRLQRSAEAEAERLHAVIVQRLEHAS